VPERPPSDHARGSGRHPADAGHEPERHPTDPAHEPAHRPEGPTSEPGRRAAGDAADGSSMPTPAFYASTRGRAGDWWTLLHPPYTAWHLGYVLLGASLAPRVDLAVLGATLLAFLLAVGVSAHALDELQGRPLRTRIGDRTLWTAAVASLAGAVAIGVLGVTRLGPWLLVYVATGALLVLAYNLELFGGRVHTDVGFALAWGAFPVATAAFAQLGRLTPATVVVAGAAAGLSAAQRALSTPARHVRRRVQRVEVTMVRTDGGVETGDARVLLAPIERALRAMAWSVTALGLGLVLARL
jgi:hypothetical protein